MSYSIFLPLRSGSQRVVNKNTKPFLENGDSLFELKIKQISKLIEDQNKICEVIISTDDKEVINQAEPFLNDKIKLDLRPKSLCLSTTKVQDLINYVPEITRGKYILWIHATSPFITEKDYSKALDKYELLVDKKYDSLMSVNKIQQFIWNDNLKKVINIDRKVNPWPNTQDLTPLYEINHAFYINSRSNYQKNFDRIGSRPFLYICEGIKKFDIDWPEDFMLAQQIAKNYNPPPYLIANNYDSFGLTAGDLLCAA